MTLIAKALNLILIGFVLYLVGTKGPPNRPSEILTAVAMLAAPISSLLALFGSGGESWLGMYFKRKKLEERRKIEKLEASPK
jgi:hypothetical protein